MEGLTKREVSVFVALGLLAFGIFVSLFGLLTEIFAVKYEVSVLMVFVFVALMPLLERKRVNANKLEKITGTAGFLLTVLFFWNMSQSNPGWIGLPFFLLFMAMGLINKSRFVGKSLFYGFMLSLGLIVLFPHGIGPVEMPLFDNFFGPSLCLLTGIVSIVFTNIIAKDKEASN